MLKTVILPSLEQIFPDSCPTDKARHHFCCLKNEPLFFQAALRLQDENSAHTINVRVDSDLPLSFYFADVVPVLHNKTPGLEVPARQGLYADILVPKKINPPLLEEGFIWQKLWFEKGEKKLVNALPDAWQTLFFAVNENGKVQKPGKHKIVLSFLSSKTNTELCREEIQIEILNKKLVSDRIFCTNWFHFDCLADATGTEMMSDEFFEAVYNYAKKAAINGQNMILTPCFTPPLDTPRGSERKTAQLVGVTVLGKDKYKFDFTLLKKYIDICKKAGIKNFEINHLFTQWGAKAAPKIMATKNGKLCRIFGWDTDASKDRYVKFLRAFLTHLTAFLTEQGLKKNVLFHISDEPMTEMLDDYKKAVNSVRDILKGFMVGDALSSFEIYKHKLTDIPIVATNHIEAFKGKAPGYWCYYTGEQVTGNMSNRLLTVSRCRNRMIGVQMYYYGVKGFLHWGYNYYYDVLSHGYSDPRQEAGVYLMSPGTSYLVYPAEGTDCYQSIRQKIFFEALLDHRALCTVQKHKGKAVADALIKKHFGELDFNTCAADNNKYLAFRDELNDLLR